MRNVDKAIEWMEKQSKNPSQSWKGLCQSTCRQAYGMGPFGSSAKDAWANVKDRYKVKITKYNDKDGCRPESPHGARERCYPVMTQWRCRGPAPGSTSALSGGESPDCGTPSRPPSLISGGWIPRT